MKIINKSGFIASQDVAILREAKEINKIIVAGLVLPKDKISRNGILYDWGSVQEHYKELMKKPMMYNHQIDTQMEPMGHFTDTVLLESRPSSGKWQPVWDKVKEQNGADTPGWYYEASLNPENTYAKSMLRGDLNKVSIQVMADRAIEESTGERNYQRAFIGTILEASGVPVPGFEQTSVEVVVAEAFKVKEEVNTTNADGAIQPTQDLDKKPDLKDEGLDKCPSCQGTRFLKLKSGQLQCEKCKRVLVSESFKENTEETKMSEEDKKPPVEEPKPVEEQPKAESAKEEPKVEPEAKPAKEEPAKEEPAAPAEKPKAEALKEQEEVPQEEPEPTREEPMEEATDSDKVAEILEKLVADVDAIKEKIGLTEEADPEKSDEEVVEETVDEEEEKPVEEAVDEEEEKPVEEPAVTEKFNSKMIFGENKKSENTFKEAVKGVFRK